MGRQSKSKAHNNTGTSANELLNFRFSTPAVSSASNSNSRPSQNYTNNNRRASGGNRGNNDRRRKQQQYRRTAEDSASVRKKASSAMFPLHSSADHTFTLTRRSHSKVKSDIFPFTGSDNPVAWDSVLVVTQLVHLKAGGSSAGPKILDNNNDNDNPNCPICLCDFVCPRITKCGHTFCLSCILRHVQAYTATNPYQHVKCPCCGIPLIVDDLRPVIFKSVTVPTVQNRIKLIKLHRSKACSAPFLPLANEPKHSSPNSAPSVGDNDSIYTRFNYVDPVVYQSLLSRNFEELQGATTNAFTDTIEAGFLHMAIDIVLNQQKRADDGLKEEIELQKRLTSPGSGIYQAQSPLLLRENYNFENHSHDYTTTPFSPTPASPKKEIQSPTTTEVPELKGEITTYNHPDDDTTLECVPPEFGRMRGDSICSYRSEGSHNSRRSHHSGKQGKMTTMPLEKYFGSMFLEDSDIIHFYQAEEGQLVFLCGFNMACLSNDFSKEPPSEETGVIVRPPFPDSIEGKILDIEKLHLTPDIRKRMPFLSHLPLYCDICFVELDLNHILSDVTRNKFKGDLQKRRKRRQHKVQAEKKADKAAMKVEADLINERKARWQSIDPDDDFFKPVIVPPEQSDDNVASLVQDAATTLGENEAGSAQLSQSHSNESSTTQPPPQSPSALDFSRACRRAQNPIGVMTSQDFPTLGSASSSSNRPKWGDSSLNVAKQVAAAPSVLETNAGAPVVASKGKKKKGKGQKISLFSTGGQRGMY